MLLRACPPGRPAAGEPPTGVPLRQPAGSGEGSGGGRRSRQAGAVVHTNGFPVQREGKEQADSFLAATVETGLIFQMTMHLPDCPCQRQRPVA